MKHQSLISRSVIIDLHFFLLSKLRILYTQCYLFRVVLREMLAEV